MGLWGHSACTKEQSYKDSRYLCVLRTNPMGIVCTNRGPILYEHTMHIQLSILWDDACSYTCEGFMSCRKNHLYWKHRPACIKRICYKEYFGNNAGEKLSEWYRSSLHKHSKMHTVKWNRSRACDKVWCKSVSSSSDWFIVCHMYCT